MVHIDIPKVKGKMAEHGYTITSLSKKLDISRNTLSSYLEKPEKTPYSIVSSMANILCEDTAEACSIFFAPDFRSA